MAMIRVFLQSPAFDPNIRDALFSTPLCVAAANADSEAVEALLKAGADASVRDAHGNTPLHLALLSEHAPTISLLQQHHNETQQNSDGATCSHLLAALPSLSLNLSPQTTELVDATGHTASELRTILHSPASEDGPSFLFYDAVVTRQHVSEVAFCTEAAARVDVLVGDSGVLLDAAVRAGASIVPSMLPACLPDLARCHSWSYLARIRELAQSCNIGNPYVSIDSDTMISAGSWEAARRSAGGVCAAVDSVLGRNGSYSTTQASVSSVSSSEPPQHVPAASTAKGRAFVVARPPGHHCG
jgi:hypothetical protein